MAAAGRSRLRWRHRLKPVVRWWFEVVNRPRTELKQMVIGARLAVALRLEEKTLSLGGRREQNHLSRCNTDFVVEANAPVGAEPSHLPRSGKYAQGREASGRFSRHALYSSAEAMVDQDRAVPFGVQDDELGVEAEMGQEKEAQRCARGHKAPEREGARRSVLYGLGAAGLEGASDFSPGLRVRNEEEPFARFSRTLEEGAPWFAASEPNLEQSRGPHSPKHHNPSLAEQRAVFVSEQHDRGARDQEDRKGHSTRESAGGRGAPFFFAGVAQIPAPALFAWRQGGQLDSASSRCSAAETERREHIFAPHLDLEQRASLTGARAEHVLDSALPPATFKGRTWT